MNNSKQNLLRSLFLTSLICLNGSVHAAEKVQTKAPSKTAKSVKAKETPKVEDPAKTEAAPAATPVPSPVVAPTPEAVVEAPIPTPTPKVELPKAEPANELYGKKNRNLGDFVVGPYLTAVALPRPISFGVEAKWKDLMGLSGAYGFFPQVTVSSVKLKITGYDFRLKIYPFRGAFFLGVGMGSQTFTGSMTKTISTIATTGTIVQDNSFIAPHMGWNWTWDSGFFMGLDLGVQLSMKRKNTFSSDVTNTLVTSSAEYTALQADILKQADLIGKTPLPLLTLIKIGYFF